MLERFVGRLLCSLALLLLSSSVAVAADGNKEVFSPWTSAPSCVAGRACIYQLGSDKQLYGVDGNGDGRAVITDDADSVHSAANYLVASGALSGPDGVQVLLWRLVHGRLDLHRSAVAEWAHAFD